MLDDLQRETHPAGAVVFERGEMGANAYFIEDGAVEISLDETSVKRLGKGELFGEIALIDHLPRTATVRAVENTVLIPIPRALVNELLKKTDPVVRHLLLTILERYRATHKEPAFDPTQTTITRVEKTRASARQHIVLSHEISNALKNREFELFYQPICHVGSARLAGFEALIRWNHPRRGFISPGEFLPVAEQTGQIRDIGLWVLKRACIDWPVLRTRIAEEFPFVSVNLSPTQLTDPGFVERVQAILLNQDMPPTELKLELTETVIIEEPELALKLLTALTAIGSRLALDDFGTGHSSLQTLQRYPIGTLKIDRTFVSGMDTSPHQAGIVRSSIDLAHSIGLNVVAEGVETESERKLLVEFGCEYAQGWAFGKPEPVAVL